MLDLSIFISIRYSIFSVLDGFGTPEEYAAKWKGHGDYLCISDHGMMAAIPRQIRACKATEEEDDPYRHKSLKPIYACEMYVNPYQIEYNSQEEWSSHLKTLSPSETKRLRKSYHLLAIAYNEIGYSNLVTLTSLAWTKGFYYKPRVNHEQLKKYKEGIIFTSCCYISEIGQAFDIGGEEAAFEKIEQYLAMFGENFRLEFMLLDFVKQKPYNAFIMKAHAKYSIPIIVTQDCHFCNAEDSKYQRYMLMIQNKRTVKEIETLLQEDAGKEFFELQDKNLWMKTEEELNEKWYTDYRDVIDYELFKQAKLNTVEICRKAGGVELDRSLKLPFIPDADEKLKELVAIGFKKLNLPKTREYLDRLKEELSLIGRKKFASYFLIVKQIIEEAKKYYKGIANSFNAYGFGRGSGVSSLVCYCIGATKINPIKHGLLFSRFLSEARDDMPDLDLDFESRTREYIKNVWVRKEFGEDYVVDIGSYNTFGIKSSLLDCARVLGAEHNEIQNITRDLGIKDGDGNELTWDNAVDIYPNLKKYCDDNPEVAEAAKKMLHRIKSMGTHAGGVIISGKPVNRFIPLVRGKEGEFVSSWTEGLHEQELSPVGFVKYDLLGITNIDMINYATELIKKRHGLTSLFSTDGVEDWTDDSFIEDEEAIKLANKAELRGIFQFDSDGIRSLAKRGGITSFGDLAACTAVFRPALLKMKVDDLYIKRKRGKEPYELHSLLVPIIGKTNGIMIYQEQVAQVLSVIGDIPLKDCEVLRKAISKKKEKVFKSYKEQFIINGQKNLQCDEKVINEWWGQVAAFSGYGFNLAHAVAYTYISFIQTYLKAHYKLEFFNALFAYENKPENIKLYKTEAKRFGVKLNPVDINKSKVNFEIVGDELCYGFSSIKGIGEAAAQKIVDLQPYSSFSDFLNRFGTDTNVLKPLIGLGVFGDKLRSYKYFEWHKNEKKKKDGSVSRYKKRREELKEDAEILLGYKLDNHDQILTVEYTGSDEDIKEQLGELKVKYQRSVDSYEPKIARPIPSLEEINLDELEVTLDEKLLKTYSSTEECEKAFYGFLWTHPIEKSPDYDGFMSFEDIRSNDKSVSYVEVAVNSVEKMVSKKNTVYWLLDIEDVHGEEQQVQMWEDDWNIFKDDIKVGEFYKMKVSAPSGGFRRYTFYGPPRWQRHTLPKDKSLDFRLIIMRKDQGNLINP